MGRIVPWKRWEEDIIINEYKKNIVVDFESIARRIGRTKEAVMQRIHKTLHLRKSLIQRKYPWTNRPRNFRKCNICGKPFYAKGLCQRHWVIQSKSYLSRYSRHRDNTHKCEASGCNNIVPLNQYCSTHTYRLKSHGTLEATKNTGERNRNWKGGVADYPNHYQFKKNRLIKLAEAHYTCECCRKSKAIHVHHKDMMLKTGMVVIIIGMVMLLVLIMLEITFIILVV